MTLSDLRTMVWSWLDDPNGTYFTSAQVDVWLNNAVRECQKQLVQAGENYYVLRVYSATVANQELYALPSDLLKINKLELLVSGTTPNEVRSPVAPCTLVEIDMVSMTTGLPVAYVLRNAAMVLRPIPDTIYRVYMDYTYLVGNMTTASSVPDVPLQYQEYLAVLAAIDGLLKDQRDPSAFLAKKDWYLSLMKQDAEQRRVDAPRSVVTTGDSAGIGYLF